MDLHIDGLTRLGARVVLEDGDIRAHVHGRLRGAEIRLPFASVGATENLMMAATLADGETVIRNAAREPEIADLALCLNAMGADITGVGSDELVIQGRETLSGTEHHVVSDRIEAGTYALGRGHRRRRRRAGRRARGAPALPARLPGSQRRRRRRDPARAQGAPAAADPTPPT